MRFREINETNLDYDIQAKYDQFNQAYFDGVLPQIPLAFANLKGVGGVVRARVHRTAPKPTRRQLRFGHKDTAVVVPGSLKLLLSSKFKRSEERLDAVLLHEMIHVYFYSIGNFSEVHGSKFESMRHRISRLSGIRIPLKDNVDDDELNHQTALKAVGVLLITKKEGAHSFMIISAKNAHAKLEEIKSAWTRRVGFGSVALYTIATPLWTKLAETFPIQRSMRGIYKLTVPGAVEDLLSNGHELFKIHT